MKYDIIIYAKSNKNIYLRFIRLSLKKNHIRSNSLYIDYRSKYPFQKHESNNNPIYQVWKKKQIYNSWTKHKLYQVILNEISTLNIAQQLQSTTFQPFLHSLRIKKFGPCLHSASL